MTSTATISQPNPERWAFFLGPDKSGSSWIQDVLLAHPEVAVPAAKDLYYFDRYFSRGATWYRSQFPVDNGTKVCVEVCHDYLFKADAVGRLADFARASTLLVCARHPVDRAVSAYLYMRRQGRISGSFSEALRHVDELVEHARYGEHLSRWSQQFPMERIHVLDFDQLARDPNGFAVQLFDAIGVSPLTLSEDLVQPKRVASGARFQAIASIGKCAANVLRSARGERLLARVKNNAHVERAIFRSLAADEVPVVTGNDRCYIRSELENDALLLDSMCGSTFHTQWWGGTGRDG